MVCDCLVELQNVFLDKTFTYKIDSKDLDNLKIGMRVEVPFGKRFLQAFVLKIYVREDLSGLKVVKGLIDDEPLLNNELLELGKFIKDDTLSTLMSSYQVMLPKGFKAKNKDNVSSKKMKIIKLNLDIDLDSIKFNSSSLKIIDFLKENKEVFKKDLNSISVSSVKTLLKKGILIEEDKVVNRFSHEYLEKELFVLSNEQKDIYNEVNKNITSNIIYLLHGVTGSGKTNIYIKLVEKVISLGKTAIILVPEISLTPQIINRFETYFNKIAVLHSGLSTGEKYDEFKRIKDGEVNIVIGARSAIFAPLNNIGIIIVDEENSSTYKQDNMPRYNAIDIAFKRGEYHNCPIILGSATPSLESYARAKKGVYKLLELNNRYNNYKMSSVDIIDMNEEFKKSNGYFSKKLLDSIQDTIDKKEQVILFLNRRGYSSFVTCRSCGHVEKCPHCDISLTYHKSSNMLRCHYCGYSKKADMICSKCGEELTNYGMGTEKVEEEVGKFINGAKILRMDFDTTSKKNAHKNIIKKFMGDDYNILIGTQMIAKGLDFPNVTLVGVINADTALNLPDFRSSERTFSLLNQVAGRAGRSDKGGKVLIQTFQKDHYAIKYTKDNDYIGFFNKEMNMRKTLKYPPYYFICHLKISSKEYNVARKNATNVASYLNLNMKNVIILGPSYFSAFKAKNLYRFQIIIKYKDKKDIIEYIKKIQNHYFNDKNVKVEIDFNPYKM